MHFIKSYDYLDVGPRAASIIQRIQLLSEAARIILIGKLHAKVSDLFPKEARTPLKAWDQGFSKPITKGHQSAFQDHCPRHILQALVGRRLSGFQLYSWVLLPPAEAASAEGFIWA
jgi:hypothetical protein